MEHIKDLQEIQIEIKKELGGASLNHLFQYTYLLKTRKESPLGCYSGIMKWDSPTNAIRLWWQNEKQNPEKRIFEGYFILVNDQHQALNIFAQSEGFQRQLYNAIQIIKNINN